MTLLPIVERELRVASRRPATWILRLVFVGGLLLAFGFGMTLDFGSNPARRGAMVFWALSITGFVLCAAAGAYLTADAISVERRERTLGLLFLTPMTAVQLVIGKLATHSLQAVWAFLGTFPLLFFPVLIGGVTWAEIVRVMLSLLLTLWLSLAVGIAWSASGSEVRTTAMGTVVTMLLIIFVPWGPTFFGSLYGTFVPNALLIPWSPMTLVMASADGYYGRGPTVGGLLSGAEAYWLSALAVAGLGLVAVVYSAWKLTRSWRREPGLAAGGVGAAAALRREESDRIGRCRGLLTPRALTELRESRGTRVFRGVVFGFFVLMLSVAVLTRHWQAGFITAMVTAYAFHLFSRVQAAWTVSRWLQDERRSGGLELLLTTPIRDSDVVDAHHESLRRVFRGPIVALMVVNGLLQFAILAFSKHLQMENEAGALFSTWFLGGALVTLSDYRALRWLGLNRALARNEVTPAAAAGRVLGTLELWAWATLAIAIVYLSARNIGSGVGTFVLWMAGCIGWNEYWVARCRKSLIPSLRARFSGE